MRDLAILSFVTLDGVMQSPSMPQEDPSDGFDLGGWAAPYWDRAMAEVEAHAMAETYDMVFGRKTYDLFADHWPSAPKTDLSERMNSAQKYVITSDPQSVTWSNTHPIVGDPVEGIQRLKQQPGPLLQVHGSTELIQTLMAAKLIDEFRLCVFPVLLGKGKKLFQEGCPNLNLTAKKNINCDNGVSLRFYRLEIGSS